MRLFEGSGTAGLERAGWRSRGLGLSVDVPMSTVGKHLTELVTPSSAGTSLETPRQYMISFLVNDTNDDSSVRLPQRVGGLGTAASSPIESAREEEDMTREIFVVKEGDETKYGCPTCSRLFRVKRDLRHHIKCVHEKYRPFSCDECGKSFSIKPNLKRHIRTVHEKQRPFVCDRCDKAFGLKENFEKHVRMVHERQRPLKCKSCPQDFTARCSLERHIARHHNPHTLSQL